MLTRIVGYVFLAVVITNTTGCSLLIRGTGVSTAAPRTRELVRREFGQPQRISTIRLQHSTGETREFEVEHYLVHRKFAPQYGPGAYHPILLIAEPVMTPITLFSAIHEIISGHSMEFVYDDEGKTIGLRYPFGFMGRPSSPEQLIYVGEWTDPSQPKTQSPHFRLDWRDD